MDDIINIKKTEDANMKTLTTFNTAITAEEAKKIISHKGTTNYPDTIHNRKMIASAMHEVLKAIQGK